jgi:hypothetical protein
VTWQKTTKATTMAVASLTVIVLVGFRNWGRIQRPMLKNKTIFLNLELAEHSQI